MPAKTHGREEERPWETSTFSASPSPHRVRATRLRTPERATPGINMVDLDHEQVLETAETIVQELLATGEFG